MINQVIETNPLSISGICTTTLGNSVIFYITSGITSYLNATFEWYLDDGTGPTLVGSDISYTLSSPPGGIYNIYLKVNKFCETSGSTSGSTSGGTANWYDGQFYGGSFSGNFLGGTFHYGILNGVKYLPQSIKPKPFIVSAKNTS